MAITNITGILDFYDRQKLQQQLNTLGYSPQTQQQPQINAPTYQQSANPTDYLPANMNMPNAWPAMPQGMSFNQQAGLLAQNNQAPQNFLGGLLANSPYAKYLG